MITITFDKQVLIFSSIIALFLGRPRPCTWPLNSEDSEGYAHHFFSQFGQDFIIWGGS